MFGFGPEQVGVRIGVEVEPGEGENNVVQLMPAIISLGNHAA